MQRHVQDALIHANAARRHAQAAEAYRAAAWEFERNAAAAALAASEYADVASNYLRRCRVTLWVTLIAATSAAISGVVELIR